MGLGPELEHDTTRNTPIKSMAEEWDVLTKVDGEDQLATTQMFASPSHSPGVVPVQAVREFFCMLWKPLERTAGHKAEIIPLDAIVLTYKSLDF